MIGFTQNIRETLNNFFAQNSFESVIILADSNTALHCLPLIGNFSETIVIPAGESNKNLNTAEFIWNSLAEKKASRNSIMVNLGGGVVCDMGSFCASTYQRGIPFVNVPTSLLAMADAAYGGKTGINLGFRKNYIGSFTHANAVFYSSEFLETLTQVEVLNGWAEIVKHGILVGGEYFKHVSERIPDKSQISDWLDIIKQSVEIKKSIVDADFTDLGIRKTLNLGHTVGHALESLYLKKGAPIPHGFAVATGMKIESILSQRLNICSDETVESISKVVNRYFPDIQWNKSDIPDLLTAITADKKNNDHLLFVLPEKVGVIAYDVKVLPTLVENVLSEYARN